MKKMIKPKKITPGSKILALSLSRGGPYAYPDKYLYGKKQFEQTFGVQVLEGKYTLSDPDWLYKNPEARAEDLMLGLQDKSIDAIVSTIGGEDSIRLLPFIDLDIITNNPKIFMGYSDTTTIHFMFQKAGVVSFYGPSIMAGFGENGGLFPYMEQSIRNNLFSSNATGVLTCNDYRTNERLDRGDTSLYNQKRKLIKNSGWRRIQKAKLVSLGDLIGGCIDVIPFLQGTHIRPSNDFWVNRILFLETSEERMSNTQFERILRNLGSQGILQKISGLLIGRSQIDYTTDIQENYDQSILKIINGELGLNNINIVTNVDFGHTDPMMTIPLGIAACINPHTETIEILDNACL